MDDERSLLHITKSLTFDREGHVVIGAPKSDAGIRDIPMNDAIREVLAQQADKTCARLHLDQLPADRRVFYPKPHPDKFLHNATANLALRRILDDLAEAGQPLERFSLHALRDTFATRFIEQGGNPQTLKTILGHSSLAMTMDLYSHVLPNTRQKEMEMVRIRV